jgi:hypothetical protein
MTLPESATMQRPTTMRPAKRVGWGHPQPRSGEGESRAIESDEEEWRA